MERRTYAMPDKLAHNRKSIVFNISLYCTGDICNPVADLYLLYGQFEGFFSHLEKASGRGINLADR